MRDEMLLILMTSIWSSGIMTVVFYFASIGWGVWTWASLVGYIGGSLGVAYRLNQARSHSRVDAFDDRLSQEKMDRARNRWIRMNLNLKRRSEEFISS